MAQGGPSGVSLGAARGSISFDITGLRKAETAAQQAGRNISKALNDASKEMQNQQKLAVIQAQQTLAVLRAQQAQITATTRAESAQRIALARSEATAAQQAARVSAAQQIEAERRLTAEVKSQIRAREQAARASASTMPNAGAGGLKNMLPSLGGLGGTLGRVGAGLGIAVGVASLAKYGAEAAQIAGQNERTEQSFESLAASVNSSSEEMLQAMQRASRGLINDSQLILGANQAIISGVADSAEELAQLLEVAAARAAATGRTTQEAFQRLVTGISRREVEVLDELGLRFNLNDVYDQYADSIGTTATKLTEAQKSAAIFNRVISDSRDLVDAASNRTVTAGEKYEQFGTSVANAKDALGDLINALYVPDAAGATAGGIDKATEAIQRWTQAIREAKAEGQVGVGVGPNAITLPTNRGGLDQLRSNLTAGRQHVLDDIATGARPASVTGPLLAELDAKLRAVNTTIVAFNARLAQSTGNVPGAPPWMASLQVAQGAAAPSVRTPDQIRAIMENDAAIADIERNAQQQRLATTQQYESQRTQVIAQYGLAMARESEDWARSRARQEQQLTRQIADIREDGAAREVKAVADLAKRIADAHADAARQEARMQRDLDRNIARMREDSAERESDWAEDLAEKIADARADSNERLVELEVDYQRNRERAAAEYNDRVADAAGRLDASALYRLQRDYARESKLAEEAHGEQISEEQERLNELIAEAEEAHAERLQDERDNLRKSIAQANEAHQRQLADAREALALRLREEQEAHAERLEEARLADAERIEDMKEAHAEQQLQEQADRALRLQRQAEDHQSQLKALATAHSDRIKQIGDQERELKLDRQDAFLAQLADLGLFHTEWLKRQKKLEEDSLKLFDAWWEAVNKRFVLGAPGTPGINNPHGAMPPTPQPMVIPDGIGPMPYNPYAPSETVKATVKAAARQLADLRSRSMNPPMLDAMRSAGIDLSASEMLRGSIALNHHYPLPAPVASGNSGAGRVLSVTIEPGAIVLNGAPGQNMEAFAEQFDRRLIQVLKEVAR